MYIGVVWPVLLLTSTPHMYNLVIQGQLVVHVGPLDVEVLSSKPIQWLL